MAGRPYKRPRRTREQQAFIDQQADEVSSVWNSQRITWEILYEEIASPTVQEWMMRKRTKRRLSDLMEYTLSDTEVKRIYENSRNEWGELVMFANEIEGAAAALEQEQEQELLERVAEVEEGYLQQKRRRDPAVRKILRPALYKRGQQIPSERDIEQAIEPYLQQRSAPLPRVTADQEWAMYQSHREW